MKDLPMFNKLFFVLCSSLLVAMSSPSAAEERRTLTIQGAAGDYEIYGTETDRNRLQERLDRDSRRDHLALQLEHYRERYSTQTRNTFRRHMDILNEVKRNELRVLEDSMLGPVHVAKTRLIPEAKQQGPSYNDLVHSLNAYSYQQAQYKRSKYWAKAHTKQEQVAKNKWYETTIAKLRAQIKEAGPEKRKHTIERESMEEAKLRLQLMKDEEYYNQRRNREEAAAKKKAEEEAAAKTKAEEEAAAKKKADEREKTSSVLKIIAGIEGPKDPNKIISVTKEGLVRELHCNPGPCTPGSVKLHEYITGIDMGVDANTLAKTIEDTASIRKDSVDTLFEQSEADLPKTNDTSYIRAQSIPLAQRIRNREAYTDYVRSAAENEAYCLYEGGC